MCDLPAPGSLTYPGVATFPGLAETIPARAGRRLNPFDITVYDKNFAFVGKVNDFTSLTVTPRHNQIGTADITLPSDHRRGEAMEADGARLVINHRGEHLMSGYITSIDGEGPTLAGQTTYHLVDDIWLLWRMLGWPVPGASDPFGTQGVKKDKRTGTAEAVLKGFVSANKAHLVDNVTVATSLGRGATITVESRMSVLADQLMTAIDGAGIGVSVRQSGAGLLVDCYVPSVFPHTLSERSGTIIGWSWSKAAPTSTVSIVGGPNENTSREFRRVRDSARETALGYSVESFVDARSAESSSEMDAAGTQALADAGPKYGFKVALSESKNFSYGSGGVRVGDTVTVSIGARTRSDVLREATMSCDRDGGVQITPAIGERSEDPDRQLGAFLANIAKKIRYLGAR